MPEPEPVGVEFVRTVMGAGAFAVMVDGTAVPLLRIDAELLGGLARMLGVSWTVLVETPTADLAAALGLVHAAEQTEGADHHQPVTTADLLARFVRLPASNGADLDTARTSDPLSAVLSGFDGQAATKVPG